MIHFLTLMIQEESFYVYDVSNILLKKFFKEN